MQQQPKETFEVPKEFISEALKTKEWLKDSFNDDYQFDLMELILDQLKNIKSNTEMFEQQRVLHYVLIKSVINCFIEQYNFKIDNTQLNYNERVEKTYFQGLYKKYVKLECLNKNDAFYQSIVKLTVKRMDKMSIEWNETDAYIIMELLYLAKSIMEKMEKKMSYIKLVCECLQEKKQLENEIQNTLRIILPKNLNEKSKQSVNEISKYFETLKKSYKKKDYLNKLKNLKNRVNKIEN